MRKDTKGKEMKVVTVKKGENLYSIAERVSGERSRWEELRDANPDRNWSNNYELKTGEKLNVPVWLLFLKKQRPLYLFAFIALLQ
jgi:hypothetical protein